MELKDRLVHDEILHLGQVIQTLSFELVVLQEFLKAQHGSKFEAFRRRYAYTDDEESDLTSSATGTRGSDADAASSASKSKQKPKVSRAKMEEVEGDINLNLKQDPASLTTEGDDDVSGGVREGTTGNSSFDQVGVGVDDSDSDTNYHDPFSDDEADSNRDPLFSTSSASKPSDRKGGRKRMKIWKFYDMVQIGEDRVSARCHLCQCMVSSRATRMVQHRIKCKLTSKGESSPFMKRFCKKKIEKKVEKDKRDDVDTDKQEEGGESLIDIDKPSNDNSELANYEKFILANQKPVGRNLDAIWQYFETVTVKGLKKSKCLQCGQVVSPKPERMKKHKTFYCN